MSASMAPDQPLSLWLRLLWGRAPVLHLDSEAPFIAGGGIHLPARPVWQQHCAAAAHAAAHLVYSRGPFDTAGLVPIARNLLALLEDARVEALAMRELPGLARLWRPLHTATPEDGFSCEALMRRLARALADPGYADPDPWVAKGRRLFYLDEGPVFGHSEGRGPGLGLGLLALRTPAELRAAALRLGHDIGQRRLPFNHRGYRPAPAYRDDHRWMWPADQLAAAQPQAEPRPEPASAPPPNTAADAAAAAGPTTLHPEWDHRIQRLRPEWCRVIETAAADAAGFDPGPRQPALHALAGRLLGPLRGLVRPQRARLRRAEGEVLELEALVRWQIARRGGLSPDARVYRGTQRQAVRTAVWLLVDRSASTAAPAQPARLAHPAPGGSVLQLAAEAAAATVLALQTLGLPCAVAAFNSDGRQAVHWRTVKGLAEPTDDRLAARLGGLRPAGSTRLGAALRHATQRLAERHGAGGRMQGFVLLLSDGEPHDIDVHDPRYLVADARQAVQQGLRRGVRMACLSLGQAPGDQARRIFGPRRAQLLPSGAALPAALRRLVG